MTGRDAFAPETALRLKSGTSVALFAPSTGRTSFTVRLAAELSRSHGEDAPPFSVVRFSLATAFSLSAFAACAYDALRGHPDQSVQANEPASERTAGRNDSRREISATPTG